MNKSLFQEASLLRRNEQMVRFDFSKEIFRNYFLGELGGEEHFKKEFPGLYAHYQEAVEAAGDGKIVEVGEGDAFEDAVDIFYGFYDGQKKYLTCKGITSIKRDAVHICQRIHVYDQTGNLVVATGDVAYHCHHAKLELNFPYEKKEGQESFLFDYFALWYVEGEGLQAALYSTSDELIWETADYVDEVTMYDPKHRRTSQEGPIVVCYNRTSQSGEVIDYDRYQEAFDEKSHRQLLYLDVGAEVKLAEEARPFSNVDITRFLLKLDCQSGIASYRKEGRVQEIMDKFVPTADGFSFQLDYDWKGVVPAARLPIKEPVDFLLRVEFLADNCQKRGRFIVASGEDTKAAAGYIRTISQLHLLWGCVAEDTEIFMAGGSSRRACNVRIGDMIMMENGMGMVNDVIRGREANPILCIETVRGRRLCCTDTHPVLTQRGFLTAGELTGEDELKDIWEGFVKIRAIYPVEKWNVISFLVEPRQPEQQKTVICEGLVTGDFDMQYRLMRKQVRPSTDEMDEETKMLLAFFKEGF